MANIPPWPATATALTLKGGTSVAYDSAALCDDGRVIYVYVEDPMGTALIKQCHYPTAEEFFLANNGAATSPVTVAPESMYNPRSCVWRHPNTEELYLFTSHRTTTPDARNKVWRSSSGNGESAPGVPDWIPHGTIQINTTDFGAEFDDRTKTVGEPFVTSTGRWVLPCTYLLYRNAYRSGIYTSDDEGATWTNRFSVPYYILGGVYGYGMCRNVIQRSNGDLWCGAYGNVEGPKNFVSSDNGTNWAYTELGEGASTASFPFNTNGVNYRLRFPAGGPGSIQSGGATFLSTSGWSEVMSLSPFGMGGFTTGPQRAILQRITSANDAFMCNGRLLSVTYTPDVGKEYWGLPF